MVRGIETFKTYFKDHADKYIIIGGTALDIQMEDAGFTPRATKDIDIILVVEALNTDFVKAFWEFIKEGNYQQKEKGGEKRQYYRFVKPEKDNFPYQIELFAKNPDILDLDEGTHLTPIPVEVELSSLSAILMDEDYYNLTLEQSEVQDDVHIANPKALIALKAKAFLDWSKRKAEGHSECDKHIKKHKADIFRLTMLLPSDETIETPANVKADLQKAANMIADQLPDKAILKTMGAQVPPLEVFKQFKQIFNLN
ncbi:nucleotidyl transferase AbiEii/AbiGii toxin family protein [Saccharicrinis fermentans]|uniref:Nucleotidyl transferase AbiEii/AbiGii toxin family protein n=1 Tax=Saccharicrinis fermentans DSM 9555 = JCM 21142 TaxID=869213 RepID=W7YTG0_9BACT|nr:nucleotidyl transferase AbiEii/AbiGii toxin family protein [Saccharicrinis fermentans]GAF05729.1 hypothetical protein JCM21142_104479 [Saccharicrinis fermentans DSM 9555 = JCM 21142]